MRLSTRIAVGVYALALVPLSGAAGQGALGTPLPGTPLGSTMEGEPATVFGTGFLAHQVSFPRVAEARDAKDGELRLLFHDQGVEYPAAEIFLRVFKHERIMELWARSSSDSTFTLMKEYPVCALPGQLGPKQRMGDFQVPEGFYYIDGFNPRSNYHLSLRVSYPNLSDRMRREAISLGGDIFVHGGCETVGCVPIENENIQEVYWLAAQAMQAGQRVIPIHIFPNRMDEDGMRWLQRTFQPDRPLLEFWQNLAEGYTYFQDTHRVPWITVTESGRYTIPTYTRYADDVDRDRDVARARAMGPRPDPVTAPAAASATAAAAPQNTETPAASERPDTAGRATTERVSAADQAGAAASEETGAQSSEETGEGSVGQSGALGGAPAEQPLQPAEAAESPEEPAEGSAVDPAPEPSAAPATGPVGEPIGEEPAETAAEGSAEEPAKGSAEEPAEGSAEESAEGSAEKPAEGSAEESAEGSAEKPAVEPTEDRETGPLGEPVEEEVKAEPEEPETKAKAKEDPDADPEEDRDEDPEEGAGEDPLGDPGQGSGAG